MGNGRLIEGRGRCVPARVGFDARFSLGNYRGMGYFVRNLIAGHELEFIALCAYGEDDSGLNVVAAGFRLFPLWEQISLPRLSASLGLDYLVAPYNTGPILLSRRTRLVLVVHDLIYLEPSSRFGTSLSGYQTFGRLYRRLVVPHVIKKAHRLIAVSEFTRDQITQRFGISRDCITVIPNTIEADWYRPNTNIPARNGYLLCSSGEAPHKNLHGALRAFSLYLKKSKDYSRTLKVVGVKPRFHAVFKRVAEGLGVSGAVEFLPYLHRHDLQGIVRKADLFFFPSFVEGFGIPLLEALACRVPVVTSGVGSLPEIAGKGAYFFDPTSVEEMADALQRVINDPELRARLTEEGYASALRFHPDNVGPLIKRFWNGCLA